MGDPAWLRSAVGVADAATQALGLMEDVTHEAFTTTDAFGTAEPPSAPVLRKAMVQRKQGHLQTPGGAEIKYQAIVAFVRPVPVDPRDRITLWDGVTGPLYVPQGGLSDPATGRPYVTTVYIAMKNRLER